MADEIMRQGVIGLADIVIKPGLINVDFADVRAVMDNLDPRRLSPTLSPTLTPTTGPEQVRAVMTGAGKALMGIGRGFGPTRAVDAALAAISSPLLDFPIPEVRRVPPRPRPRPGPPNRCQAEVPHHAARRPPLRARLTTCARAYFLRLYAPPLPTAVPTAAGQGRRLHDHGQREHGAERGQRGGDAHLRDGI